VHYAHDEVSAKETVDAIHHAGGSAFAVRAPFDEDGALDLLFAGLAAEFGDHGLDIVVSNAGVFPPGGLGEVTPEEFDRLIAVNAKTPYFLMERAVPIVRDGGRIVLVSSNITTVALPQLAYTMSKGALEAMCASLAWTLGGRRITVNTVAPGVTETDMTAWLADPHARAATEGNTALGRIGRPEDIARVVAFLASEDGGWITGQRIDTSGGMFLGPAPLFAH
jgi:NAD(P)-dependent dehydrogenase (short-subunit alcohol dehydrogenase family)